MSGSKFENAMYDLRDRHKIDDLLMKDLLEIADLADTYFYDLVREESAVQRVRDLHKEGISGCCTGCPTTRFGRSAWESYPCPTIRALDGE